MNLIDLFRWQKPAFYPTNLIKKIDRNCLTRNHLKILLKNFTSENYAKDMSFRPTWVGGASLEEAFWVATFVHLGVRPRVKIWPWERSCGDSGPDGGGP